MTEIGFYYPNKPGIQTIPVANKWSELLPNQLAKALAILHHYGKSDAAAVKLLALLLHLDRRWFLRRTLRKKLGTAGLADALEYVVWMFTPPELAFNKFPKIVISNLWKKSIRLYGPTFDKIFEYMTFVEWVKTETYFKQYLYHINSPLLQEKALNRLVAALYREKAAKVDPLTHNGDQRAPFNDHRIDHLEKLVTRIPIGIRLSVFYHFSYHRKQWAQAFTHVYGGEAPDIEDANASPPNDLNLFKAMKNMAGGALHFDSMATVSASAALLDLDDKIKEYNELKAKSENGA